MDQLNDERLPQLAAEIAQMRGELRDGLAMLLTDHAQLLRFVGDPAARRAAKWAIDHVAHRDADAAGKAAIEARWQREHEAAIAEGRRLAARLHGKGCEADAGKGNETLIAPSDLSHIADRLRALMKQNAFRIGHRGEFGDLQPLARWAEWRWGLWAAGMSRRSGGMEAVPTISPAPPDHHLRRGSPTRGRRQQSTRGA